MLIAPLRAYQDPASSPLGFMRNVDVQQALPRLMNVAKRGGWHTEKQCTTSDREDFIVNKTHLGAFQRGFRAKGGALQVEKKCSSQVSGILWLHLWHMA